MVLGPRPGALTLGRSLEVAWEHGHDQLAAIAMSNLGSGAGEIRRYPLADRWLGEAVAWCAERDLDANLRYVNAWLARCHFEQGRWCEAGTAAASLAGELVTMTPSRIVALTVLGRLRARRGDPDALAPLEEAWELAARTGDLQRTWPVAAGRAELAWLSGQAAAVPGLVAGPFELARRLGHGWAVGELGFWLWRVGERPGPPAGAARPYRLEMAGDWRAAAGAWRERPRWPWPGGSPSKMGSPRLQHRDQLRCGPTGPPSTLWPAGTAGTCQKEGTCRDTWSSGASPTGCGSPPMNGANPEAIRDVAERNGLPVDRITEVSVLDPYFYH